MKKLVRRTLLVLAATLAVLDGPALAYSNTCVMVIPHTSCTTQKAAANRANHFIHISASGGWVNYELWDTTNFITVAAGNTGMMGMSRTINGLYATYRLTIRGGYDVASTATISNE